MIEGFKVWINSMLCIGIFVLFIKLVIPNNHLKKYIYSMIGIITIITVISPVMNFFENDTMESSLNQVISDISSNEMAISVDNSNINKYQDLNNQAVKQGFIDKLSDDIKSKLENKGVSIKDVEVNLDNEYGIEKIKIAVKKYSQNCPDSGSVITFVKNEYDIDSSKVEVRGE
ncbi:MAG: stage III sporulation protein AF [Clostridia bacterium]|nr:stage III sporulation protein AF [Clostridia bacterium]